MGHKRPKRFVRFIVVSEFGFNCPMFIVIEGYYAYVHSGAGSFFDDATLQSPNMTQTGPGCIVSFYYHMYTTSSSFVGTLYLKLNYKGSTSTLFEVDSNQGNKWKRVQVGVGELDKGN